MNRLYIDVHTHIIFALSYTEMGVLTMVQGFFRDSGSDPIDDHDGPAAGEGGDTSAPVGCADGPPPGAQGGDGDTSAPVGCADGPPPGARGRNGDISNPVSRANGPPRGAGRAGGGDGDTSAPVSRADGSARGAGRAGGGDISTPVGCPDGSARGAGESCSVAQRGSGSIFIRLSQRPLRKERHSSDFSEMMSYPELILTRVLALDYSTKPKGKLSS